MKKIAYLLPSFPVFSETFIGTEIRAMEKIGHEIMTISFDGEHARHAQPHDKYFIDQTHYLNDIDFPSLAELPVSLKTKWLSVIVFVLRQTALSKRSLLHSAFKLAALIQKNQCQHIHAHFAQSTAATAIVAARILGITVSFVGHGHDVYASPFDLPLKLSYADLVIAVCEDMVNDFRVASPGANIALVYCGIEPGRFEPCERFPTETRMGESRRFLFVGRLTETKGVADILQALSTLDKENRPALDIVGEGELFKSLKAQVPELGLDGCVRFLGKRSSAWIADHCAQYRAMICPFKEASNGNRDTGPVVVKEAMAMGMPVITTYFMGCKEMVTDQTGIRVKPGDVEALSYAIETMLNMRREEWQEMALASIERVTTHFTASYQAGRLSHHIESLQ